MSSYFSDGSGEIWVFTHWFIIKYHGEDTLSLFVYANGAMIDLSGSPIGRVDKEIALKYLRKMGYLFSCDDLFEGNFDDQTRAEIAAYVQAVMIADITGEWRGIDAPDER